MAHIREIGITGMSSLFGKKTGKMKMKKEFIDHLYELRAAIQLDIDNLVEKSNEGPDVHDTDILIEIRAELRTRRNQILSVNRTIEKYFEIHGN